MSDNPFESEEPLEPQDSQGGEEPAEETSDLLDQSMIDALMAEASATPDQVVLRYDGSRIDPNEKVTVEFYDFRNPVFLTEMELRQVRIRHEQFIHYLAARMSMFLRMDFSMKMSKLFTAQYSKFTQLLPNPAFISVFKMEQITGVGVLSIDPRLAMTITDRMLGGKGHSVRGERYLTEIESALMEDVVQIYLEEWCRQWEDTIEVTATPVGQENNGRFLQTSPHDAIMLVLCIEAVLGDCSEEIQIGVPYYTIEPLIKKMQANNRRFNQEASETDRGAHWRESYAHIEVPIVAEWDAWDVPVRDLMTLTAGDVIELPREIIGQTKVKVVGSDKFIGEVGLEHDQVAVKITDTLQSEVTDN